MATTVNPEASSGISIGYSVSSIADWLRKITVCIRGPRGSRGSGVSWRDGLIMTNAHVAVGKRQSIGLFDGRKIEGWVVARDPETDLAAIEIEASGLPTAVIRSPRELRAGEMVIAVGNPWDGEGAVSAGILHRAAGEAAVVFADIRLAPGNSGGPLADANGRVLGINCAVFGGLGCVVASDTIQKFLLKSGVSGAA